MKNYEEVSKEWNYLLQYYSDAELDQYAKFDVDKIIKLYNQTQPKKIKIGSLKNRVSENKLLVSSPDGWVPVTDCVEKIKDVLYTFVFASGASITASHDHLFQKPDLSWHYARDLKINDDLISAVDLTDTIISIKEITNKVKVYDLSVDHANHRYYTNGICSHNSGKSLFMQNISVNWFTAGLNGIYITLELSEGLCSMRIDAMVANCGTRDIRKNIDDVELKVRMASKKSGHFQVKYMPAQSNVNDIRAYVREFQIQTGVKADFIMVDYLDLLMPVSAKVSPNDLFLKDKYVSEELRNLAEELNILFVTASQLNRSAVDEVEFDHSHISGGISKINTADNVFGIFTSRAMRERGKYQLQLLKTRSSSGVGRKVDLDFNIDSLRITDSGEETNSAIPQSVANNILGKIKLKSTVTESETKPPKAEVESTKLKEMLANLQVKK